MTTMASAAVMRRVIPEGPSNGCARERSHQKSEHSPLFAGRPEDRTFYETEALCSCPFRPSSFTAFKPPAFRSHTQGDSKCAAPRAIQSPP